MELKSILIVTLYLIYAVNADHVSYKKVCYYTNWSQYRDAVGKFTPGDIDPFLCTHVIFAFAKLSGNRIVAQEWNDETVPWRKGLYQNVTDLKKTNPNVRILLSVGGWSAGGKNFSDMAATQAGRAEFATSTVTFLRKRFFDGLDIDWEFPGSRGGGPTDKDNLSLLLKEVSTVFNKEVRDPAREKLILSIAVPASQDKIDQGYNVPDVSLYCDIINVMTYNYHGMWDSTVGHHSALFKRDVDTTEYQSKLNMAWTINYWISKGAQANKLIVGFAPFGRGFTLADPNNKALGDLASGGSISGSHTKETGFLAYYEICKMLKAGATVTWDDVQKVPHLVLGNQWVGYDNERSIKEKVKWLKNYRFGGIMVWALPLDDFKGENCGQGETYPILRSIIRELNKPDRVTDQSPVSSDIQTPVASLKASPDQVQSETGTNTNTVQDVPLVSGSSNKIGRLKKAKDQSGPALTAETEQTKQAVKTTGSLRKTGTKVTSEMSDPKKEVLSDVIVNTDKVSATKVKSSNKKQVTKTSAMEKEPLVNVASNTQENKAKQPKTDGKAKKGSVAKPENSQVETIVKSKPATDEKAAIVTATSLSDSLTQNNQGQGGVIGKAKVVNEVELTQSKTKVKSDKQKTKISDGGQTDPLVKNVLKASAGTLQADNRKIAGVNKKKNVTKVKSKIRNKKPGNDGDSGTRLSSALPRKGTESKKIGDAVFTAGQPVYSAPDVKDLQLTSRDSGNAGLTEKQPALKRLKDKKQTSAIIQKDIPAVNIDMNDASTTKDQEMHSKTRSESKTKTIKDLLNLPKDQKSKGSKTDSEPGTEKNTKKPSVNNGETSSKFTSRKLLQMNDNDGGNGNGLGNMINSLFGMMSGFTAGGFGRQPAREPRNNPSPTIPSVTDNPFIEGSNDIRTNNRRSRQRQRSRDRSAVAINNRERSMNSIALDRERNTRDRSMARNGRDRAGVAVDRTSSIRSRSNQLPVDTFTGVSPLPPTASPFDIFDFRDPRERGRLSTSRDGRTIGIQERLRSRPVEDTRTARERLLDAMILAEQLPDPGPLSSQNGNPPRDQLRSEAELLLPREQSGVNDPFRRDRFQSQIRDPALIRSREPDLVETLRRRISDRGRSRGNSGAATNSQTTGRGGRFQSSRNSGLRRNIAVDALNSRNRPTAAIRSGTDETQRNGVGIQRSGVSGNDRQRSVVGIQAQGRDRQRNAVGVGPSRRRNAGVGVQDAGNDRQRTSVGVQSTGVGTDRRTGTGIQSLGTSRQRTMVGVQGLGTERQRTAIGVGSDLQRQTVGISPQNGRGSRQRSAVGVQSPSNDRQRPGIGIQNSDFQRPTVGIQSLTNERLRTAVGIESLLNDRQRAAIGIQGSTNDRQRTAIGVQSSSNDRQRPTVGIQGLANDRQRAAIGIQGPSNDRQRTAIGIQSLSNDRQRTSIGIQNPSNDRQRTAIGVQSTTNDRQRPTVAIQGSSNDRQRTTIGIQGSLNDRQRTAIGIQSLSNDRQRTSIGIQTPTNDRQRTAIGVQSPSNDRQRPTVGIQGTSNDRQRTAIGVQESTNDRQRTSIGVQGSTNDRQRTAIGIQSLSNDRQRPTVGIQGTSNDRQRTAIGVQSLSNDRQRPTVGIQGTSNDRQRTAIGVQSSSNDRQRTAIGIQSPSFDRQRPTVGIQGSTNDRQRTAIGIQSLANDLQRTPIGVQGSTNDQRSSIGVQNPNIDRSRTAVGVVGRQRTTIGVQRTGDGRQRTSIGIQGSSSERQRSSIGVQTIDRQRTAIGVQRAGNDRSRTSVGVDGSTDGQQRTAVGVQNADRQRTAIGVQRVGNDLQRPSVGVLGGTSDLQRTVGVTNAGRQRPSIGVQSIGRRRTTIGVQRAGNDRQRASVGVNASTNERQRTAVGVTNTDRQRTAIGVQGLGVESQRTSVGIQGMLTDRQRPSIGIQTTGTQRSAIGIQRTGNNRQRTAVGVQGSTNNRQRTTIGVQNVERQRTAVGVQATGDVNQRPIIGIGGAIPESRPTVAINSILPGSQLPPISTIAVNAISGNQNPMIGIASPESNRIIGISGNTVQTGSQSVATGEVGTIPVAVVGQSSNRNAIENSIGELLAQINAQQLTTTMEKARPTVSIAPTDPSINFVPLNNIENSLLNSLQQGPPIQILNNTDRQPLSIAVSNNVNSVGGPNAMDLINSLAANRMSMPDSPMSNNLTPETILAAMAVAQSRPVKDVVNEPILLEIQPQILPTEPPLSKDIADALMQLLRNNVANPTLPPPNTTPVPFKQDAMQTPNQVLVSTGEQPKDFPPPLSPRRQPSNLATNATVIANNNQPKGLSKADVLWKWEA